ncbi:hypothetical protein PACTADRAFT_33865 [Pachysolen tannophilus NRRL Y-2460]|uniref:Uncharacterized protein n=1 Tax=Pachysolen tannophilus NRRL Y-2460 TaxID=669874 RepID=A0A1E4TU96_PACTA|nr:hypothetical protein PACTADRAFT_33865 [Pachysolen tannophilus NRRL Y-2460]
MSSIFSPNSLVSRSGPPDTGTAETSSVAGRLINTYAQSSPLTTSTLGKVLELMGGTPAQANSRTVHDRITKLIKAEKKVIRQQQELIRDLNSWLTIIPNDDSKKLLNEFSNFLEIQADSGEELIHKQENIKLQLVSVQKRESKAHDLKNKRNKLYRTLRDQESKVGDIPVVTLTKENLEELEISVEVVEEQYIRAINSSLKSSLVDYTIAMSLSCSKFKSSIDRFFNSLASTTSGLIETPKKYIYSANTGIFPSSNSGSPNRFSQLQSIDSSTNSPIIMSRYNQPISTGITSGSGTPVPMNPNSQLQQNSGQQHQQHQQQQQQQQSVHDSYLNMLKNQITQKRPISANEENFATGNNGGANNNNNNKNSDSNGENHNIMVKSEDQQPCPDCFHLPNKSSSQTKGLAPCVHNITNSKTDHQHHHYRNGINMNSNNNNGPNQSENNNNQDNTNSNNNNNNNNSNNAGGSLGDITNLKRKIDYGLLSINNKLGNSSWTGNADSNNNSNSGEKRGTSSSQVTPSNGYNTPGGLRLRIPSNMSTHDQWR